VWGDAIIIPKKCNDKQIENYKYKLEIELNKCIEKAKIEANA